jgi:hypothetical protein
LKSIKAGSNALTVGGQHATEKAIQDQIGKLSKVKWAKKNDGEIDTEQQTRNHK